MNSIIKSRSLKKRIFYIISILIAILWAVMILNRIYSERAILIEDMERRNNEILSSCVYNLTPAVISEDIEFLRTASKTLLDSSYDIVFIIFEDNNGNIIIKECKEGYLIDKPILYNRLEGVEYYRIKGDKVMESCRTFETELTKRLDLIDGRKWKIYIGFSLANLDRAIRKILIMDTGIWLIFFFITLAALYKLSNVLLKPIDDFKNALSALLEDRKAVLSQKINFTELESLYNIFNNLSLKWEDRIKQLENLKKDLDNRLQELSTEKDQNEKELKIAKEIQKELIGGSYPVLENIKIETFYEQAGGSIGGDFYFIEKDKEGDAVVFVGDVSGHGVPAALIMSLVTFLIRRQIIERIKLSDILKNIDREIRTILPDTALFITALLFRVDVRKKKIYYSTAGHHPFLLYNFRTNKVIEPQHETVYINCPFEGKYEEYNVNFEEGDRMVIVSDGVIECRGMFDEFFDIGRIRRALLNYPHLGTSEFLNFIKEQLYSFNMKKKFDDDVTMIIIDFTRKDRDDTRTKLF
ncbi:MAG: SpoIIE family protein phosphatase [Candidatus Hydrogenedentota bacterium]